MCRSIIHFMIPQRANMRAEPKPPSLALYTRDWLPLTRFLPSPAPWPPASSRTTTRSTPESSVRSICCERCVTMAMPTPLWLWPLRPRIPAGVTKYWQAPPHYGRPGAGAVPSIPSIILCSATFPPGLLNTAAEFARAAPVIKPSSSNPI